MPWFKLDDKGAFHRKVLAAGNEAYGAWCRAGQWCSEHTTDGALSPEVTTLIAGEATWQRLVDVGLCEYRDGVLMVHDYLDYNPSRREVLALKGVRSESGKAGGIRSGRSRSKTSGFASTAGEANDKHDKGDGTGRDGSGSGSGSESGIHPVAGRKARAPAPKVPLPPDWAPTDIDRAFAAKHGWAEAKTNFEADRFRAHHEKEQTLSGSWAASWRTWVLNDEKFAPANKRQSNGAPMQSRHERQIEIAKRLIEEAKARDAS